MPILSRILTTLLPTRLRSLINVNLYYIIKFMLELNASDINNIDFSIFKDYTEFDNDIILDEGGNEHQW